MEPTDPIENGRVINAMHEGTFAGSLGLVVESASRDAVVATVTIEPRHLQPQGIVHGGVHASIVETVASVGAAIDAMGNARNVVGLENHTSFVRAARAGVLRATATPITRGRRTQVWDVVIRNLEGETVSTGRVRFLVLEQDADVRGAKLVTASE